MSHQLFEQRVRQQQIALKLVLLLSGFVILAIAYYYMFRTVPRQSDVANTFLAGHDMSKGNWRLKGWWLGADNFVTTDIVFYAMLVKCLGLAPQIMFYLPAMLWAGVALLSVVLAQGGMAQRNKKLAVASVATPILLPIIRDHAGMSQISESPMHIGTIIYVLLCFLLVKKVMAAQSEDSRSILVAYSLIMLVAIFADPIAIFIGAMPVIGVAAFSVFRGNNRFRHSVILILTVLAVAFGRILVGLNSRTGGFEPCTEVTLSFVTFADLAKNISVAIHYFFILFGCDFFGKRISASLIDGAALSLIRLPFLALLVVAMVQVGKKFITAVKATEKQWPVKEGDYLDALLAAAFTINVLSAVFSNQLLVSTDATIRYFFPALVFGAILVARTLTENKWFGAFYFVALAASLAFTGMVYAQRNPVGQLSFARNHSVAFTGMVYAVAADPGIEELSTWLSNSGLANGFGPYWSSSIVTALTANRVKVRALISDADGKIKPFEFMANKKWYEYRVTGEKRGIFVLAHDVPQVDFYNEAAVIRSLGEPSEKHNVGSFIINVYDAGNERLRSLFLPSTPR